MKFFCSMDGLGVVWFYPLVETGGSCRIPSPPPYPTQSCHLYSSALMHFAATTSAMQEPLVAFNLLRRSFEGFVFSVACLRLFCESVEVNLLEGFTREHNQDVH